MKFALDKKIHFIMGVVLATVFGLMINPVAGFVIGILAGVAKEVIYDNLMKKGTPEVLDAVATIVGSGVGAVFSYLVITYGVST